MSTQTTGQVDDFHKSSRSIRIGRTKTRSAIRGFSALCVRFLLNSLIAENCNISTSKEQRACHWGRFSLTTFPASVSLGTVLIDNFSCAGAQMLSARTVPVDNFRVQRIAAPKSICHCEPVLRLVWQSPRTLHTAATRRPPPRVIRDGSR